MQPIVFISYSRRDEAEKEQLLAQLDVLQHQELIQLWNEAQLGAGADWEIEIRQAINQAKIAILLISANFLTTDFILDKTVPTLLQRRQQEGLIIFPIIAKPCAWQAVNWLTQLQVRPMEGRPIWRENGHHADEELSRIALEVAEAAGIPALIEPDGPSPWPKPVPHLPLTSSQPVTRPATGYNYSLILTALGGAVILSLLIVVLSALYFLSPVTLIMPTASEGTPLQYLPTSTSTPTSISKPQFGQIVFSLCFDGFAACEPPEQFTAGITEIHAVFEFSGMSREDTWERVWYLNEREVLRTPAKAWDNETEGIFDNPLTNRGEPIPVGVWRLELYVNGQLIQSGSFAIEAN